jgi:hypothetical protein
MQRVLCFQTAWKMKGNGTYEYQCINLQTQLATREDPKLDPLSPPWKYTWNGDVVRFENARIGEQMKVDPKLTTEIFKAQGIDTQCVNDPCRLCNTPKQSRWVR